MSNFEQIMQELDAPDYPATCDRCGYEGTNATTEHLCLTEQEKYEAGFYIHRGLGRFE